MVFDHASPLDEGVDPTDDHRDACGNRGQELAQVIAAIQVGPPDATMVTESEVRMEPRCNSLGIERRKHIEPFERRIAEPQGRGVLPVEFQECLTELRVVEREHSVHTILTHSDHHQMSLHVVVDDDVHPHQA